MSGPNSKVSSRELRRHLEAQEPAIQAALSNEQLTPQRVAALERQLAALDEATGTQRRLIDGLSSRMDAFQDRLSLWRRLTWLMTGR